MDTQSPGPYLQDEKISRANVWRLPHDYHMHYEDDHYSTPLGTMQVEDVELKLHNHLNCSHQWKHDYWAWLPSDMSLENKVLNQLQRDSVKSLPVHQPINIALPDEPVSVALPIAPTPENNWLTPQADLVSWRGLLRHKTHEAICGDEERATVDQRLLGHRPASTVIEGEILVEQRLRVRTRCAGVSTIQYGGSFGWYFDSDVPRPAVIEWDANWSQHLSFKRAISYFQYVNGRSMAGAKSSGTFGSTTLMNASW
jgi:hypothetical protein